MGKVPVAMELVERHDVSCPLMGALYVALIPGFQKHSFTVFIESQLLSHDGGVCTALLNHLVKCSYKGQRPAMIYREIVFYKCVLKRTWNTRVPFKADSSQVFSPKRT